MTKQCRRCNVIKTISTEFYKNKTMNDGHSSHCKECVSKASRGRSKRMYATSADFRKSKVTHSEKARLMKSYGLTLEHRQIMLEKQQFRCAVCNIHQDDLGQILDVDHDHETGKVREMLCWRCNRAEGLLKGNTETITKLLNYILKHREIT